jgi:hypothetical protein
MNELEIFTLMGIIAAFGVVIFVPQASRVAPLSVINLFAMVSGVVVTSMAFLAFNTNWIEPDAWRSGVLIVIGGLIVGYMNRWIKNDLR